MAITLSGSTIVINSGVASGTATGGSTNTLTGSGFGSWAGRIVWITGGTGAGQSRFIRSATANTLTVEPNWDTNPNATSTFQIGYTWADIDAALAGVTASSTNYYLVPYNLSLSANGFIGSVNESVRFTTSVVSLSTSIGSLWQQGRLLSSGKGVCGGAIEIAYSATAGFNEMTLAGRIRWYGAFANALPGLGSYRINITTASGATTNGLDFRNTEVNSIYLILGPLDRFENSRAIGRPFLIATSTPITISGSSIIEASFIISVYNGTGANTHHFGLTFEGTPSEGGDSVFLRPYWVDEYVTKDGTYFWDTSATAFANTFAASYWYLSPSGGFHTGYTVAIRSRFADATAASNTVIGLWETSSGNAAWFESVNLSTGLPVNSLTITTDANGNYSNPHPAVAGQSGLVVRERLKRTGATTYGPWTIRARKYGYLESGGARSFGNRSDETMFMLVNPEITQTNSATVAAYTTLETSAKLYDYYQYFLSLAANIKTNNSLTRSGTLINAGSYNVTIDATAVSVFSLVGNTLTIKATTYTGDMTTTGLITLANGAIFNGARTDANGTIAPPVIASITGLTAGSRIRIYNNSTSTEVVNTVVAGTSYTATYINGTGYTTGNTLTITATWQSGTSAKLPFSTQVVVGSTGWSALVNQQNDTVYNGIGIDGSTVTEFAPDYPNIQVDISDPNGQTSIDRMYSWFVSVTTSADGIRNWFGGIVAEDAANFRVVTSILNLKLDNLSATGVEFTGGLRLYRDDNASPLVASTTGGGSISLYAGKVYTSVVSTESPVITGDISQVPAAVQSGMTAQGYTSARAGNIDRLDVAVSTRTQSGSTISANITQVNGIGIDGVGTAENPWGPV